MTSKECCTFRCSQPAMRGKQKVVWMIDGKPYCNTCFLEFFERNEVGRQRIVRLYNDESLYEDRRPKKRAKRTKTGVNDGHRLNTSATHAVLAQ